MTNEAVPAVTIQMGILHMNSTDPEKLELARGKARHAVDALTLVSRAMRTTKWPQNVSALCAKIAARQESFLPPMRRIAAATTVEEAEAAFAQFEEVRGPTGPDPNGVIVRQRLGLPPPISP
jgi:hypothetical protein